MTTNITMPPLPAISEDTFESSIPISQPLDVPSLSLSLFPHDSPVTEKELSSLSPTQVKEILQLVTFHLKKNGRITPDLQHLLKNDSLQPKISTSSTPSNNPTLLSIDKMSNTAPNHMRYTIQQLSRYFGFRLFINWDILHDVCQQNFSFFQPSESPLELGHVANIKKGCSNKVELYIDLF